MKRSTMFLARLGLLVLPALLAVTAGASAAGGSRSCGIVNASGHQWIVVAKSVPCGTATHLVQGFAARTAALHTGARVTVASPLSGFHCLLASQGKPGGSCTTAGATKSVLWIAAA